MSVLSKNGKFEIFNYRSDDDSYFYGYSRYNWFVVCVETGDGLFEFYGSEDSDRSGTSSDGIQQVYFESAEEYIVAEDAKGEIEKYELPVTINFVENGEKISLHYKNGNEILAPRRRVIYTSKYGEPFSQKLKYPGGIEK